MLKIWGRATSTNVQKVLWACGELEIEFSRVDIGGQFGGLNDPVYREKNPNGLIPTIEHDGFILWESHAILRYLATTSAKKRLYPENRMDAAIVDQWLDWQMIMLGWRLRGLFMVLNRPEAAAPGETLETTSPQVVQSFQVAERRLKHSRYIAGEAFTIADISVGISAHRWLQLPIERPKLPALETWFAGISARPAFAPILAIPVK